jgi:hypothetical protein
MIVSKGIYDDIADAEYFGIDLPSSTATKTLIGKTNLHLAYERENPRSDTDAFTLGALVHALVLKPALVETAFIKAGRIDRRTTAGKAEYEALTKRAQLTGARIIGEDIAAQGYDMADAVMNHSTWSRLDGNCQLYETVAIGEIGGRLAKAKIDAASTDLSLVYDLKTCADASPNEFSRAAAVFGYAHQAAFYRRVLASLGKTMQDFVFVCVEKDKPHAVALYRLNDGAIDSADALIDALVARWWAVKEGNRDGYGTDINDIDLPTWAYAKNERIA